MAVYCAHIYNFLVYIINSQIVDHK